MHVSHGSPGPISHTFLAIPGRRESSGKAANYSSARSFTTDAARVVLTLAEVFKCDQNVPVTGTTTLSIYYLPVRPRVSPSVLASNQETTHSVYKFVRPSVTYNCNDS